MKMAEGNWNDEVFSYVTPEGRQFHWNMSAVLRALAADTITPLASFYMDITDADYIHVCEKNGIEEDHLLTITPERLKVPVIFAEFPPEAGEEEVTHALVDGNHRLVQAYRDGGRKIPAQVLAVEDMEPYLVDELMGLNPGQVQAVLQSKQQAKP